MDLPLHLAATFRSVAIRFVLYFSVNFPEQYYLLTNSVWLLFILQKSVILVVLISSNNLTPDTNRDFPKPYFVANSPCLLFLLRKAVASVILKDGSKNLSKFHN